MRIATNTIFNDMANQIQDLDATQNTLESELSTGLSFTEPSDNPTGMSSVLGLVSQDQEESQYAANANTALQISQASYTGLSQLYQLSNSVDEIATEANSSTNSTSQLQTYATQINEYLEQAVQVGNTQFEGNYLYSGTAVSQPPFQVTRDAQGDITSVSYVGNTSQASIPLSSSASIPATTTGASNQAMAAFMNQLVSLRTALQNGDSSGVATAQTELSASNDAIISATAENSAIQSAIQSQQTESTALQQNLGTLISSDSSADVASTDAKLTEAQTSYQAVLESSARIMQTSLLNYLTTTTP
jgi:flagellar hook-associated protein 3 FlgL